MDNYSGYTPGMYFNPPNSQSIDDSIDEWVRKINSGQIANPWPQGAQVGGGSGYGGGIHNYNAPSQSAADANTKAGGTNYMVAGKVVDPKGPSTWTTDESHQPGSEIKPFRPLPIAPVTPTPTPTTPTPTTPTTPTPETTSNDGTKDNGGAEGNDEEDDDGGED